MIMAENDVAVTTQPEIESEEERLKYLEFVQVAVLHAIVYASKVYGYAKENSRSLKPGVETIEGTLKTVVSPAYHKFHHVPAEFLKFVDHKVDESITKLDTRVPPFIKQMSTMATEVKTVGVVETTARLAKTAYTNLEPTAKELYTKYEPVAEKYAVSAWHSLNQSPLFPKVAKVVVPTASYYSEKYNQTLQQTAEKGYKVSSYLPFIPTERIAEIFNSADQQSL